MQAFFALIVSALAFLPIAVADTIPEGAAAHFRFAADESIVFGPDVAISGGHLVATTLGDGTFNDPTSMFATFGTGAPGPIVWTDFCITAAGASSTVGLKIVDCKPGDSAQIWTVNESGTVSNADGNCITLANPVLGSAVTLSQCSSSLVTEQTWDPEVTNSS